jgi:hypothetical protein
VELYIGLKTETYKIYGFHEGEVGLTYTFQLEKIVLGRWVRITTIPSVIDFLTLCEVQVFGYDNFQCKEQIQILILLSNYRMIMNNSFVFQLRNYDNITDFATVKSFTFYQVILTLMVLSFSYQAVEFR